MSETGGAEGSEAVERVRLRERSREPKFVHQVRRVGWGVELGFGVEDGAEEEEICDDVLLNDRRLKKACLCLDKRRFGFKRKRLGENIKEGLSRLSR